MTTELQRNLVTYVASELTDRGATGGKTKFVKLLYLVDVEHFRRFRRPLSGFNWLFYHYGPYAFEVDDTLGQLHLDLPQETVTTKQGQRAFVFRPQGRLYPRLEPEELFRAKDLIDQVLVEWGAVELVPILNHVYFYTEPMKNAKRGQKLDFATIARRTRSTPPPPVELSEERLAPFRSRFQEATLANTERGSQRPWPPPRLDDVFKQAVRNMDAEERFEVPKGTIRLAAKDKENLREMGEGEGNG